MWFASDTDFRLSFEHMHERIEWCGVLTQALSFIKRKDGHVPSWLLNNFAADNGAVLVVYQPGDLRDLSAGDPFRLGCGFWFHGRLLDQRFFLPLVTGSLFLGFFRVPKAFGLWLVTATE